MRMKGKAVLITGGSSGIGFATAKRLAEEGARVAITGRNEETLSACQEALGEQAVAFCLDATDFAGLESAIARIVAQMGELDAVFLNAGDASITPIGATTEEQFDHLIATNLKSPLFYLQALLPHLRNNASVVFNSSIGNTIGLPGMAVYAASKAGLVGMARCLASELSGRGIRVNVVSPGNIRTPFWRTVADDAHIPAVHEFAARSVPMGRLGEAEEIANAVLFLCSDESSYVQAAELYVDGGVTGAMMGAPAYRRN
ncbi:NAD(P)-dependent dehydrogenase (short-subunit alcohol dehydrogenase family) [Burkholderia sp. PvR073]|uniref:SDR family oxidoreductase n=1 Tax=Burkholderia ambifaria TaxID=152480 RepID=UPI003399E604